MQLLVETQNNLLKSVGTSKKKQIFEPCRAKECLGHIRLKYSDQPAQFAVSDYSGPDGYFSYSVDSDAQVSLLRRTG